jgi:hypothetical protein
MLEEQLNQAAFAGPKMPMDTAVGQAMQHRYWLLREKPFEFVASHSVAPNS